MYLYWTSTPRVGDRYAPFLPANFKTLLFICQGSSLCCRGMIFVNLFLCRVQLHRVKWTPFESLPKRPTRFCLALLNHRNAYCHSTQTHNPTNAYTRARHIISSGNTNLHLQELVFFVSRRLHSICNLPSLGPSSLLPPQSPQCPSSLS